MECASRLTSLASRLPLSDGLIRALAVQTRLAKATLLARRRACSSFTAQGAGEERQY